MLPHNLLGLGAMDLSALPAAHYFFGPALLYAILVVHYVYYRSALKSDGQQVIEIEDLTDLSQTPFGQSVVSGDSVEFCVIQGIASAYRMPCALPRVAAPSPLARKRFEKSVTFEDVDLLMTIVCAKDLLTEGTTTFHGALKVGGDLTVRGTATFAQPVIVSGKLKVEGDAHFSRGLIVKRDAIVTGDITIGTRENKGWAIFRSLSLATRLRLNGQVISDRDLGLPKAA